MCFVASHRRQRKQTDLKPDLSAAKSEINPSPLFQRQRQNLVLRPMTTNKYTTRPAKRLIHASTKCSQSGTVYGQCILLHYQDLKKGICDHEFQEFKRCVMKNLK